MPSTLPVAAPGRSATKIRARDLAEHHGVTLDLPGTSRSDDSILMQGEFVHCELRPGLTLHFSNVREECAFVASSSIGEGVSCVFFMEGRTDLTIGSRPFRFEANARTPRQGRAIFHTRPDTFVRRSLGEQSLRHLVVSATPEWLDGGDLSVRPGSLGRMIRNHMASVSWPLTPKVMALIGEMLTPSALGADLRRLLLEARAAELVAITMAATLNETSEGDMSALLPGRDLLRLRRAKEFIAANLLRPLTMVEIAREAGINPSGLQRLFRHVEHASIFEYVRDQRLARAFAALEGGQASVSAASAMAGYTNPANFATAFRRRFGVTPREAAKAKFR